jgi:hypothetical protein
MMRARLGALVRRQPLVALAAAGAVGALLGGVFFSRLGRLVFLAAAGYVASEMWHRKARVEVHGPAEKARATR